MALTPQQQEHLDWTVAQGQEWFGPNFGEMPNLSPSTGGDTSIPWIELNQDPMMRTYEEHLANLIKEREIELEEVESEKRWTLADPLVALWRGGNMGYSLDAGIVFLRQQLIKQELRGQDQGELLTPQEIKKEYDLEVDRDMTRMEADLYAEYRFDRLAEAERVGQSWNDSYLHKASVGTGLLLGAMTGPMAVASDLGVYTALSALGGGLIAGPSGMVGGAVLGLTRYVGRTAHRLERGVRAARRAAALQRLNEQRQQGIYLTHAATRAQQFIAKANPRAASILHNEPFKHIMAAWGGIAFEETTRFHLEREMGMNPNWQDSAAVIVAAPIVAGAVIGGMRALKFKDPDSIEFWQIQREQQRTMQNHQVLPDVLREIRTEKQRLQKINQSVQNTRGFRVEHAQKVAAENARLNQIKAQMDEGIQKWETGKMDVDKLVDDVEKSQVSARARISDLMEEHGKGDVATFRGLIAREARLYKKQPSPERAARIKEWRDLQKTVQRTPVEAVMANPRFPESLKETLRATAAGRRFKFPRLKQILRGQLDARIARIQGARNQLPQGKLRPKDVIKSKGMLTHDALRAIARQIRMRIRELRLIEKGMIDGKVYRPDTVLREPAGTIRASQRYIADNYTDGGKVPQTLSEMEGLMRKRPEIFSEAEKSQMAAVRKAADMVGEQKLNDHIMDIGRTQSTFGYRFDLDFWPQLRNTKALDEHVRMLRSNGVEDPIGVEDLLAVNQDAFIKWTRRLATGVDAPPLKPRLDPVDAVKVTNEQVAALQSMDKKTLGGLVGEFTKAVDDLTKQFKVCATSSDVDVRGQVEEALSKGHIKPAQADAFMSALPSVEITSPAGVQLQRAIEEAKPFLKLQPHRNPPGSPLETPQRLLRTRKEKEAIGALFMGKDNTLIPDDAKQLLREFYLPPGTSKDQWRVLSWPRGMRKALYEVGGELFGMTPAKFRSNLRRVVQTGDWGPFKGYRGVGELKPIKPIGEYEDAS